MLFDQTRETLAVLDTPSVGAPFLDTLVTSFRRAGPCPMSDALGNHRSEIELQIGALSI